MSAREGTGRGAKEKARQKDSSPLHRLQERGEHLLDALSELRKTILPEGEQNLDTLLGQIEKVRDTVSRRAQETGRDLEARAEQALGDLEHEVVRRLGPVFTRANVLSRADVAPLESRIAHLEGRLGTLLDDRATLTSRVVELERSLDDARAIANEREREATMALSTGDGLQQAITDVREHLDALSRDHVSRNLESGKLEDRLVRLEMRLGDVLKEQSARVSDKETLQTRLARVDETLAAYETRLGDVQRTQDAGTQDAGTRDGRWQAIETRLAEVTGIMTAHDARLGIVQEEHDARATEKEEIQSRLARVNETLEESAQTLESAATEATAAIAATRELGAHIETLRDERTADRSELFQLAHRIGDMERTLRQCDLRLGDLTERHTAGREELASLAARISQLELAAARPTTSAGVHGQAEGH